MAAFSSSCSNARWF